MHVDLLWCHNNGVIAVLVNFNGRFARFIQRREAVSPAGTIRVWVFGNPQIKTVDDTPGGEWFVHDCDLRAFHGNLAQWDELKAWMGARGVTYARGGFHVPFSNGKSLDSYLNDYEEDEYTYRRDDNPRMAIEAWLQVREREAQDVDCHEQK